MEANKKYYQNYQQRTSYVDGSAVRKLSAVPEPGRDIRQQPIPEPRRQPQPDRRPAPQHEQQRAPRMVSGIGFASMLVLTIAIVATFYFCVEFLMLQYDVNSMEKEIVSMERSLSIMKNENDAAFGQIDSTYDLDYVYQVAVGELGMVYPNNNTVVAYKGSDEGYVRQYRDIPE